MENEIQLKVSVKKGEIKHCIKPLKNNMCLQILTFITFR